MKEKESYFIHIIFNELKKSTCISLPLIASQLIYAASGIISAIMIAHLGKDELATNVIVWGIYIALISISFGILSSISVFVSQAYGANDRKKITQCFVQGFFIAIVLAAPMSFLIYSAQTILFYTGQESVIINLSIPYFHSLAWCMLPLNLLFVMEQFLIGLTNTRLILFLSVFRVPLEIFLFYVLFFGKLGLPTLGLVGIGYGMTISIIFTVIILGMYIHMSKKCRIYKVFSNLKQLSLKYCFDFIKVGLPLGIMYCMEMALFAVVALMIGKFGKDALAAHQIAYQYLVFAVAIIFGISQATTVRVGYETGRNNKKALKLAGYVNMGIGFCIMLILLAIYITFASPIISLSVNVHDMKNQNLVNYSISFLTLAGILQLIDNFRLIITGILRGLKDTKITMYITLGTFWLIALPFSYLFAFILKKQATGIWWGLIFGFAITAILLFMRFEKFCNKVDLTSLIIKKNIE